MAFPNGTYAPPGVYTSSRYENPTVGLLEGLRIPIFIGTGSEILSRTNLEMIRGSSASVDQRIVQEDETGRAVVSIALSGLVTLGAFDGALNRIQVRKYPIVDGNGTGTTATRTSAVAVTINDTPIVVTAISAATGVLTLATPPQLGDEVRVTYFFKRTDTLVTDDLSSQVTEDGAQIYGAVGESYTVVEGGNDTLTLTIDDATTVTITIPDSGTSTWSAAQVAAFIVAAAGSTTLSASTAENNFGETVVVLTADGNLEVGSGSANSTIGFTAGDYTARNKTFYTFQGPIVDGSNGGVTTTDPSDVTVLVDGVQVIPATLAGANRAVTLLVAPVAGATVSIQYYFNAWQDTFDYLMDIQVTEITSCGVSPGRTDFTDQVDFILQNDRVVWGTALVVSAGEHTAGTTYFNDTQVSGTLVDTRGYMQPATAVVDTAVSPPVESRTQFTLSRVPTTGNGRNSPLGTSLFQTVANDRIDLPTNRPDLVLAYWGFGVQDAIERGAVTVTAVDSATSTITLKDPVPVGAGVWATYYYNTITDQEYSLSVVTAGASGVGTYTILNEDGTVLLTPTYGTKSSGLSTVTLQFPSGSERKSDVRFEIPTVTTDYAGAVQEDVTVELAATDGTVAMFSVPGAGDYEIILNASDRIRLTIDGSALAPGAAGIDLGSVNGVANLGFAASLVGDEVEYDADTGYTTYVIDSTNNSLSLIVDGVLISASATASGTATIATYVSALNTAADAAAPVYKSSGKFLSSVIIAASMYDRIMFHYTGNSSGLSGNLTATITPATYASVSTLATAIETAMATAIATLGAAFTGLAVDVTGDGDGHLEFALTRGIGVAATGTVTAATVLAGNTVTIDGVVFTALTGARTPGNNDFDRTGTDIATATDLVAAINDATNWVGDPPVVATNVGGTSAIVTLTASEVGTDGNAITLTSSGATLAVSGATLSGGLNADASGYLEFITGSTAARDFCVLAGIDTAAATAGAQTKLVDGPIARRYTVTGDSTSGLLHDRAILRSRVIPGFGTVAPDFTLSYAGIETQGGTGDVLSGLAASRTASAARHGCVQAATLIGAVNFLDGQVVAATYGDARDGQPVVTFYADGGTTDQNNVFKVTMDGVPVTVEFTDAAGAAIASASSANVPLGPAGTANTVIAQIRAAMTAAGLTGVTTRALQEGAAIRLVSGVYSTVSNIVIGDGNANATLGFDDGAVAERILVSPDVVASGLMAHSGATISAVVNSWTSPSNTYFTAEALASVVTDAAGATYLYLQSLGAAGLGTESSIAFAAASSDSILLPSTGLGVEAGDGATGEEGISGFFVTSSDPVDGSGTINTSLLNSGVGQDGIVGQTYTDLVTGLTFTLLPRSGGADYPAGETFTFRVRSAVSTDSNTTRNTIPGVELLVTNTLGCGVEDTAVVETFARGGEEPAIGDIYYVSYNYTKQSFDTTLFTRFASIEAAYGTLSPDNPVSLASYLAILNGAVLVGIKQVQKDVDDDGDGIYDLASVTAFRDAVDSLDRPLAGGILPDVLVPLRGDSTSFFQYITRHADIQSDVRHAAERTVIAGVASGTSPRAAGAIAQAIQRTRFRLVYPDGMIVPLPRADGQDEDTLVDGTYIAAMLAGSVVSPNTDVATPWTNRRLQGATRLSRTLDAVEMNQVAVKGVTVIEDRPPVLRVRHGLTTDMVGVSMGGQASFSKLPTIVQISDEVQQQARTTLNRFIGTKFLPGVLSQIEGQLSNTLKLLVQAQIIVTYTGVRANISPDDATAAEVEAFVQPITPLLYLICTFNIRSSL